MSKTDNPLMHLNIEDANYALRQGVANHEHADEYVSAWNATPGRFHVAVLVNNIIHLHGVAFESLRIELKEA